MKRLAVPIPPNPGDAQYKSNPMAYMRASYDWMLKVKQKLEVNDSIDGKPVGPISVTTGFTTNTVITGSSTGTDVTNFICTLVTYLNTKGIVTPTTPI